LEEVKTMLKKMIAIPLLLALLAVGGLSGCYASAGVGRHGASASGGIF
jgi:predicted small secreted protein